MKIQITFNVDTSISNLDSKKKIKCIKEGIKYLNIDVEDEIICFPKCIKIKEIK